MFSPGLEASIAVFSLGKEAGAITSCYNSFFNFCFFFAPRLKIPWSFLEEEALLFVRNEKLMISVGRFAAARVRARHFSCT